MFKKTIAMFLGISMVFSMVASGSQNTEYDAGDETEDYFITGGWSYNQGEASLDDNADAKKAYDRAADGMNDVDPVYEPIAYIGSQTVAGTNYAVFCRETAVTRDPEKEFCLMTVYEDPDGNSQGTDIQYIDLDASDYSAGETETDMAAY